MNSDTTIDQIDLTSQVAIVTGGGRGIGRAIALALAKAGANVAVTARSTDQIAETVTLIEEVGGCGMAVTTDVTESQAVQHMVDKVEKRFGPVDLLVNNAGVPGPGGPMWETDSDEWWHCLNVNLRGPYLCYKAVLTGMVALRQGRVVTVASGAGLWPQPFTAAYSISKCAVIRFSETLARETKDHNISAFSIHPGFVHTAMVDSKIESREDEKWLGGWFSNTLRQGNDDPPERAAELVMFLASGKEDGLSGCFFTVTDDVVEMVKRAEEIQKEELYTLRLRT